MLVTDLFSGLGGWSAAFKERGHEVFTVDIDPRFEPDLVADIMDVRPVDLPPGPHVILASPPCSRFSAMCIAQSWEAVKGESHPRNVDVVMAVGYVAKTLDLVEKVNPPYWVMENPLGMLRKVVGPPRVTTYHAAWNGGGMRKATDLWGKIPGMEWPKLKEWDHVDWTPRKYDAAERARMPYPLSEALCKAIERELEVE